MLNRRVRTATVAMAALLLPLPGNAAATPCNGTVYLSFDTGTMAVAEQVADTLRAHAVRATFFVASEPTLRGDRSLDAGWSDFWRRLVAEGHAFGSHTFDHVYFRGDATGAAGSGKDKGRDTGPQTTQARPQFGEHAGRALSWNASQVCAEIERVDQRFQSVGGRALDRLWRAPGGRAPLWVIEQARACGWRHVGWTPAGFLGDELPSDRFPNAMLLQRALRSVRDGDILMAHLGIRSRAQPWAQVLDPLLAGLLARGLCFATLNQHPQVRAENGAGPLTPIATLPDRDTRRP